MPFQIVSTINFIIINIFLFFSCTSITKLQLFRISKVPDIPVIEMKKDQLIQIKNENRIASGSLTINSSKLCIFLHASRTTIKGDEANARTLYANGFSIFLPEYPGYGISSHYDATETTIYSDVSALISFVMDSFNFKNENVFLYGSSLGTGVAFELAKSGIGSKMVLVAPFTSTTDIVQRYIPFKCIVKHVVKDKFDNLGKAESIRIPVLILHGADDKLFPQFMSEKLHNALYNSNLIVIPGITHKSIWKYIETDMIDSVINFFNRGY